jgi:hypothetical protein
MASPLLAPPPLMVTFERASRASSRSRDRRATTRVAASFWYSAVLSSCRVCASWFLRVYVSRTIASHSFWKAPRSPGIEVRFGARGVTTRGDLSSIKSSTWSSSPVTGSVWCSARCASMRRFSKTLPLLRDATGSRGASPEMAQSMLVCVVSLLLCSMLRSSRLNVPATFPGRRDFSVVSAWHLDHLTCKHRLSLPKLESTCTMDHCKPSMDRSFILLQTSWYTGDLTSDVFKGWLRQFLLDSIRSRDNVALGCLQARVLRHPFSNIICLSLWKIHMSTNAVRDSDGSMN